MSVFTHSNNSLSMVILNDAQPQPEFCITNMSMGCLGQNKIFGLSCPGENLVETTSQTLSYV